MRVIIRRPHAYKFKQEHRKAPIPGVTLLDADGKFLGGVALPAVDGVDELVDLLGK